MKKIYLILTLVTIGLSFFVFFEYSKTGSEEAKAAIYNKSNPVLDQIGSANLLDSRMIDIVPDEYIIKFKSGNKLENLKNVENENLSVKSSLGDDTYLLENPQNQFKNNTLSELTDPIESKKQNLEYETKITKETIKELEKKPEIESIEPNQIIKIDFTPNDPLYSSQWHLNNTGQSGGTVNKDINAPEAWDITQGSSNVIIAVIDTGVDLTHPDLQDKIARNGSNQVIGFDFANNDNDPTDTQGHGTHLAGIIAGKTNNSMGISGVCPNCKIMPVKFMDNTGSGTTAAGISAINFAVNNGAKVLNLSWGSNGYSPSLQNAIINAYNNNVLVVASAGNDNVRDFNFPADMNRVISVAATDRKDLRAFYSNFSDRITVTAPGSQILSTLPTGVNLSSGCGDSSFAPNNDGYGYCTGTSMAAPVVAGIAGLVISQNPTFNSDQIAGQIMNTSDDIDSLNPSFKGLLGLGRVNAFRALTESAKPNFKYSDLTFLDTNGNNNFVAEAGEEIDVSVGIQNYWIDASNVQATLSTIDSQVSITQNTDSIGDIDFTFIQRGDFRVQFDSATVFPKTVNFVLDISTNSYPNQQLNFAYTFKPSKSIPNISNFGSSDQDWQGTGLWHLSNSCFAGSTLGTAPYFHFGKDLCGDYDFNLRMIGKLYSPPFNSSQQQLSLSFDQFLETENQPNLYDKATVKIKAYGASDSTATTLISPQINTVGWENKIVNLPKSITSSGLFQVFFDFDSIDPGNNITKGWFIDNIKIESNEIAVSDFPTLIFNCPDLPYNSNPSCSFNLPNGKSLPTDFKLKINQSIISNPCMLAQNSTTEVSCNFSTSTNSVGIFSVEIVFNGDSYNTNTQIKIIGQDFGKANFIFNNDPSSINTLLFKSIDDLPVKITNYRNIFDPNPTNSFYKCSFDLAPIGSASNQSFNSWTSFGTDLPYDNINGCQSNITKSQRGNGLGFDIRVKVCTTSESPSCSILYDQYIFRFEGAGLAIGV